MVLNLADLRFKKTSQTYTGPSKYKPSKRRSEVSWVQGHVEICQRIFQHG